MDPIFDLTRFPVHLGLGSRVVRLPEFTREPSGYEEYGEAHTGAGPAKACDSRT